MIGDGVGAGAYCEKHKSRCAKTCASGEVELTTGKSGISSVQIFPNPSNDGFQIHTNESVVYGTIEVVDQKGNVMYNSEFSNLDSEIKYGKDLEPGVYAVRIAYNGLNKAFKYICQ